MCLQKSNLCTAIFIFGVASPAHSLPFALYRPGVPAVSCPTLCALARCLCSLTCCFLPLSLSFLFCSLRCIVPQPSFWGALFPTAAGVGPRQQRMAAVSEFVGSPVKLCRGESHSGAPLALSPLLSGWSRARSLSVFFRTHSRPCQL